MIRYTFRQLEYFVAVGELQSIAKAAEKLNVSSPSISVAITHLEKEFGVALFIRHHAHGVSLTAAGKQLLKQAKQVLGEADSLAQLASEMGDETKGTLAVGCLVTFAQILMPALRRSFEDAYSEVQITQYESNQAEIFKLLRSAKIDVALTYDLDLPSDLTFIPLIKLPPFVMLDANHRLKDETAIDLKQIKDDPLVLLDLPLSSEYFVSLFTANNIKPIIAERTTDIAVMRSFVGNGFGYALANMRPRDNYAPDGKLLHFVPLKGKVRPLNMGLLLASKGDATKTVKAFIEHCCHLHDSNQLPIAAIHAA